MAEHTDYQYDVFISHNESDREWVAQWLLPRLEQAGVRAAVSYRDFIVGTLRIDNVERAITNSRRTIVVLTPDWLSSEWNAFEAVLLRMIDPAARRRKLLPILLKPCELPPLIDSLEKVDLTSEHYWERQLQRLIRDIEDVIPVPFPWKDGGVRDFTQWRRWLRRYRRELRRAAGAIFALWLIFSIVLQLPPFQPRLGWQALGLHVRGAWHLIRVDDVLLASTNTDFADCTVMDTGLWRSVDQGDNWTPIAAPLEFKHPSRECTLAAITAFAHAPGSPGRIYAATTDVGLLSSDDAGERWEPLGADDLPENLMHVAVSPTDPDNVFVTGIEAGLYRSVDGGDRWQRLDGVANCPDHSGEKRILPTSFKVGALLASSNALYVGTGGGDHAPAPDAGLFVSYDNGSCWQRLDGGEGRYRYQALAEIPSASDRLLVLTYDYAALDDEPKYQLWQLQEGGGRGRPLWQTKHTASAVYVDPGPPTMWYVTTNIGEVSRGSPDRPGTWEDLASVSSCLLPPTCFTDLTQDFVPDTPLLLANDRVYRLNIVPWYRRLWP